MTKIGEVIEGKYEILKEIGKGGMSVVYLAMDKHLNKQWAVKEIKKADSDKKNEIIVNSILAEADLMKRLDHPALPRIVDIIDNGVSIYVVMDYIEGESLGKILDTYGAQPQETVVEWAKQLCDVLSYLHSQNPPIIYRDMKPANVMLKPEGYIKVIDFGIAREYKAGNLTDTAVLGTRGYAPPEQHGARQTDVRSDIYALGMTMHHLLTGADPRPKDYIYASIREWKPNLSDSLERIVDKCTAIDPDNRYQSCAELMYALQHIEEDEEAYKKKQKRRLAAFIASAAMAVMLAVTGVLCNVAGSVMNSRNYDKLISVADTEDYDKKISDYKTAISIYPGDTRAYMKLLEAYEYNEEFGREQSDEFNSVFPIDKEIFDQESVEYAELNYKIGLMYFNYYEGGESGESSFSDRVKRAYEYFRLSAEESPEEFESRDLAGCYFTICSFYKKYILSGSSVEEASLSEYNDLMLQIENAMSTVEDAGKYDQLAFYNGVFMLLYDQRNGMESVGVDEDRILGLFDRVYENAAAVIVNKEQSLKLQNEVLENYESYRSGIENAYRHNNVKE